MKDMVAKKEVNSITMNHLGILANRNQGEIRQ